MMAGTKLLVSLHIILLSAGDSWAWTTLPSVSLSSIDHQLRTHHHHTSSSRIHKNYQPSHHHVLLSATSATESTTADITSSILKDINPNSLPILHIQGRIGSGSYGTVHQGLLIKSQEDVQSCITKRCWTFSEIENNVPIQIYNLEKEEKLREEEELAIAQRTGLASVKQQQNGNVVVSTEETTSDTTKLLSKEEIKTKSERCKHYWNVERHIFEKLSEKKKTSSIPKEVLATPEFLGVYQDDGNGNDTQEDNIKGYGLLDKDDGKNGWFSTKTNGHGGHEWMVFEFVGGEYNDGDDEEMPAQTLLDAMEVSVTHIISQMTWISCFIHKLCIYANQKLNLFERANFETPKVGLERSTSKY